MYLLKSIIRKSQMTFDFGKHEEERTVHATTRHLQSGAVAHVKEHQRKTVVADKQSNRRCDTQMRFADAICLTLTR